MKHLLTIVIITTSMFFESCSQNEPNIKVGFATSNITDCGDKGTKGIHDELQGGVIWVESKTDTALLIAVDLIGISLKETEVVKQIISNSVSVPISNMFISASHTHASIPMVSEKLGNRLAEIALKAKEQSVAAKISFTNINADKYNFNRRVKVDDKLGAFSIVYNQSCVTDIEKGTTEVSNQIKDFLRYGTAIYNPKYADKGPKIAKYPNTPSVEAQNYIDNLPDKMYADAPKDSDLNVLRFYDLKNNAIGTLVRFSAHPVLFRGRKTNEISADYPGIIKREIAKLTGVPVHFMIGPCGNLKAISGDYGEKEIERYGNKLVKLITDNSSNANPTDLTNFSFVQKKYNFQMANDILHYSEEDFTIAIDKYEKMAAAPFNPIELKKAEEKILRIWGGSVVKKHHKEDNISLPLSVINFNDVVIATMPGEIFTETSIGIKNNFPNKKIITVELTDSNDPFYVPIESAIPLGGYEVSASALVPGSAERIEKIITEIINNP